VPKGAAILADIDGRVEMENDDEGRRLRLISREEFREDYPTPENAQVLVDDGEMVEPGMVLAAVQKSLTGETTPNATTSDETAEETEGLVQIVANVGGKVEITPNCISVVWEDVEVREHIIPAAAYMLVGDGDEVKAGAALISGPLNPHDILHIRGKDDLQGYLVDQVQQVYQSQGVGIHDKHIEIILRQMLRRVSVESTGDSDFIPGQMVDKFAFQNHNAKVLSEGGEPATAKPVLLGVTRASLLTDSFLSAASFQETTRVLTQAAVSGAQDWLLGLKENVIIGRLIPARVDIPGMAELLKPEPIFVPEMAAVSPGGWLGVTEGPASPLDGESGGEAPVDTSIFGPASGNGETSETPDTGDVPSVPQALGPEAAEDPDLDDDDEDFLDEDDDDEEEVVNDLALDQSAEIATNGLSHNGGNGLNGSSDEEGEENVVPDSDEGDE
jgi:hypothetical protein